MTPMFPKFFSLRIISSYAEPLGNVAVLVRISDNIGTDNVSISTKSINFAHFKILYKRSWGFGVLG